MMKQDDAINNNTMYNNKMILLITIQCITTR